LILPHRSPDDFRLNMKTAPLIRRGFFIVAIS